MAGPPLPFEHRARSMDALVQALVATGSISDASKIYWDIRLPQKTPTVPSSSSSRCLACESDEAVMLAGLMTRPRPNRCAALAQTGN